MKKIKRKIKSSKRDFKIVFATVIFMALIGGAFAIDWIFGIGFIFSFLLAIYNKVIEKNFLIPVFIFIGAMIIRFGIEFLPSVLEAKTFVDLAISFVLLMTMVILGWKLKKGKLGV
ncbi:MAG: hypothetical protein NUV46_01265 [Nanoarchaeota archaeon]|nr:hypothetical protein [Nanoarchaeota archaeon]